MNPAPATSARDSSGLAGSTATMAAARSAGLRPAPFARRNAMLELKSPCCASRVRSTTIAARSTGERSRPPCRRSSARASRSSSSVFTNGRFPAMRAWENTAATTAGARSLPKKRLSLDIQRIDVDGPAHPPRLAQAPDELEPGLEEALQFEAPGVLEEQLGVVAPGAPRHRGAHGSEEPDRRPIAGALARGAQKAQRIAGAAPRGAQQREAAERGPAGRGALCQRAGGKSLVAAVDEALQQRVFGIFRLDQHLAGARAASGAPGHLHDGLRQAFGGAKIGAEQALVGIDHGDQRYAREMVTLGHHLRSAQDARRAHA